MADSHQVPSHEDDPRPDASQDDEPQNDDFQDGSHQGESEDDESLGHDASAGVTADSGSLSLPEALLLLALEDKRGRVDVDNTAALPYGLAAAVLLTLSARGYIRHDDQVWKVERERDAGQPDGRKLDAALTPALEAMSAEDTPRGTMHWLRTLPKAGDEKLHQRLLTLLVEKNVLVEKKHRFLGLFPYRRYPTENPDPERQVREHVRQAVLEGERPDDRTLALIALMDACGLTDEVFDAKERKKAADRLDELTSERRVAQAISEVNAETTNAVLAATTAATAAATRKV